MRFLASLLVPLLVVTLAYVGVVTGRKHRDYTSQAASKLVFKPLQCDAGCGAWTGGGGSPLPKEPSESQCALALQRIVKQPQNCGQKYLSGAARSVYLPIYNWFDLDVSAVALQYANDNGVGVEVYDAFGNEIAAVNTIGKVQSPSPVPETYNVGSGRTWALNYPTYYTVASLGLAFLAQNIYSVDGQVLLIVISKELTLLPQVC